MTDTVCSARPFTARSRDKDDSTMPVCVREDGADGASTRASSPSPDLHSNGSSTTDILEEEAPAGIVVRTVPVPHFSQVSRANVRAISQAVGEGHSCEPFVEAVATILIKLAACFEHRETIPTRFHCVRAPQISLHDYLQRIATFFHCSPACFVVALVYIDRIMSAEPTFVVNKLCVHRLAVVSIMVAAKFIDDDYYSNAFYGKVAGLVPSEVNALEARLISMLRWRLHVQPEQYERYYREVALAR